VDIEAVLKSGEGVSKNLGIEFAELTAERVVATMPVDERHHQPFGYLHGGVSCPPGKVAFGSEINASHVRPKRSGKLTAVGAPAHVGRRTQVWEVHITDEEGKTVCLSRCTLAIVDAG
jgi:1,4-dihydroxy-2-naphthoyl-CoA hydrolase